MMKERETRFTHFQTESLYKIRFERGNQLLYILIFIKNINKIGKVEETFMKTIKGAIFSLLAILSLLSNVMVASGSEIQSNIFYAKPGETGDCSDWVLACDLQTALSLANAVDQVWVAAGTYYPTSGSDREATFQLETGVAIYGGFPVDGGEWEDRDWQTNETILSGDIGIVTNIDDNSYHVVTAINVDESAILDGLTISGGNADGMDPHTNGGGMVIETSSPTLTNLTFSNNTANNRGGAIHNFACSPILTNVTFSNNTASAGGGIFNDTSSPILVDSTFTSNTASFGGGMVNSASNPTFNNVSFIGNSAGTGGAINSGSDSTLSLTDVVFTENSANLRGGGMFNASGNYTLTNVIFSGNTSTGFGGAIYNMNNTTALTNVTFSGNTADYGGAIYNSEIINSNLIEVTFTENRANTYSGGGMHNDNSSPNLSDVIFSNNWAGFGGGMSNLSNSNPTLMNTSFTTNDAVYGAGMYNLSSSPTLTGIIFTENIAIRDGGGIYNASSSNPNLMNVTFSSNIGEFYGGGIYNDASSPTLDNVTFTENFGVYGGGMANYSSSNPSLTNVTFSGNLGVFGGGLYNEGSSPLLTNVTFAGNDAQTGFGGAIYNISSSNPVLTNAIIWANTPDQISDNYSSAALIDYSTIQDGYTGTGNIDLDPLLGELLDNGGFTLTHALEAGSPAIDSGNPDVCALTDQRGNSRPFDGDEDGFAVCDMGAYEYQSFLVLYLPFIVR